MESNDSAEGKRFLPGGILHVTDYGLLTPTNTKRIAPGVQRWVVIGGQDPANAALVQYAKDDVPLGPWLDEPGEEDLDVIYDNIGDQTVTFVVESKEGTVSIDLTFRGTLFIPAGTAHTAHNPGPEEAYVFVTWLRAPGMFRPRDFEKLRTSPQGRKGGPHGRGTTHR